MSEHVSTVSLSADNHKAKFEGRESTSIRLDGAAIRVVANYHVMPLTPDGRTRDSLGVHMSTDDSRVLTLYYGHAPVHALEVVENVLQHMVTLLEESIIPEGGTPLDGVAALVRAAALALTTILDEHTEQD